MTCIPDELFSVNGQAGNGKIGSLEEPLLLESRAFCAKDDIAIAVAANASFEEARDAWKAALKSGLPPESEQGLELQLACYKALAVTDLAYADSIDRRSLHGLEEAWEKTEAFMYYRNDYDLCVKHIRALEAKLGHPPSVPPEVPFFSGAVSWLSSMLQRKLPVPGAELRKEE